MILPSIWTRIIRREIVGEFKELNAGEDLIFILDIYDKAKFVFLNDKFITNYPMHADSSIPKNTDFTHLLDLITSYKEAIYKCNSYGFPEYNRMINLFLMNYSYLLMQSRDLNSEQKGMLNAQITEIDRHYKNRGFLGFLLVNFIKLLIR